MCINHPIKLNWRWYNKHPIFKSSSRIWNLHYMIFLMNFVNEAWKCTCFPRIGLQIINKGNQLCWWMSLRWGILSCNFETLTKLRICRKYIAIISLLVVYKIIIMKQKRAHNRLFWIELSDSQIFYNTTKLNLVMKYTP